MKILVVLLSLTSAVFAADAKRSGKNLAAVFPFNVDRGNGRHQAHEDHHDDHHDHDEGQRFVSPRRDSRQGQGEGKISP